MTPRDFRRITDGSRTLRQKFDAIIASDDPDLIEAADGALCEVMYDSGHTEGLALHCVNPAVPSGVGANAGPTGRREDG